MEKQKNLYVVANCNQWSGKFIGSGGAANNYHTHAEAIACAWQMVINNQSEMHMHGRDGRVGEKNSYVGNPQNITG